LPPWSAGDLFRQVHDADPRLPVIFVTAGGSGDTAIEAIKLGAHD
jgi:two-component system nitrogen regulation response regulator GlnG